MESRETSAGIIISSKLSSGWVNCFSSTRDGSRIASLDSVYSFRELKLNEMNLLRQVTIFLYEGLTVVVGESTEKL